MTDPISDMLTRLRNASLALAPEVEVSHSRMKEKMNRDKIQSPTAMPPS